MRFLLLFLLLATAPAAADKISCTEQQAIAVAKADADIVEFCAGAQYHGCDFKVRPQLQDETDSDAQWLVTASIIHSFDDKGAPRFMPEGAIFAHVSADCRVTRVLSHGMDKKRE
jgi:hypothetical protein